MVKAREIGAIDMMCYLFTPEREKQAWETDDDMEFKHMARTIFKREPQQAPGYTPEQYVAMMDKVGIDKSLICVGKMYSYRKRKPIGGWYNKLEEVVEVVKAAPGRIYGLAGYDPLTILKSVQEVERSIKEFDFKGVYIHTYGYGLRPDDRKYYPLYETCASLGVPVSMQVGHSLEDMPGEMGRPLVMDNIALDFPELNLIGSHTGWPWSEELIAMAFKHDNVYMDLSAWPPRSWDPSLVRNIDSSRCRSKTMWGSNAMVERAGEMFDQMDEMLKDETKLAILRENAMRLYKL
ncbi:hypothetical protein ES703_86702 [subsurface metagenome]